MSCDLMLAAALALAASTALAPGTGAVDDRPVLAVRTFENPTADAASTIGAGLTHIFITELEKTGRYRIVEREALGTLLGEVDLGESGYLDSDTSVTKGRVAGVEYWFFGTVTNFGAAEKSVAGGLVVPLVGGLGVQRKTARVRLDFRVVDATTGETILADFGEAAVNNSAVAGAGFASVLAGGQWFQKSEFLDSMLGRATIAAVREAIDKLGVRFGPALASRRDARPPTGRVLAVADGEAFVDLGADAGVAVGDLVDVLAVRDVLNAAGETVYRDEEAIGVLTLTGVQRDKARGVIPPGLPVTEGTLVRARARPPSAGAEVAQPEPEPLAEPSRRPRRRAGVQGR